MGSSEKDLEATASSEDIEVSKALEHEPNLKDDIDVESQATRNSGSNEFAKETEEEKAPEDDNVVTWDGPNDPENPMNWSSKKKVTAVAIISFITFLSPLGSTIISPATEDVMKAFNSTDALLGAFITSVYLLGYVFGPLVIAPLSELYGRAIMYNICNFLYVIWTVACALAPNESALIVFRLLAGIAASCPLTLGAGTIADMVPLEKRGLAMVFWACGPLVGPTVGPIIGGYLGDAAGWRWVFWLLSIVSGVCFIITFFFVRESYAYVLLAKKTKRLRKETGNPNLKSALDTGRSPQDLFKVSIIRPIKMLFLSPIVALISAYMALIYGTMYLMFTTFERVFRGQYGFSNGNIGLTYIGLGIGGMIGLFVCGAVSDRWLLALRKRNNGVALPEYRLPPMIIGAFLVPIGLFLYAWTADKKVQWMAPIIGTSFLGAGMLLIFMPSISYLVDAYTVYAASANAASTVFRSLLGALLPLAGNSMYDSLGIGWGTSLLAFITVAFLPVPLVFYKYGERIRKSKYTKKEF